MYWTGSSKEFWAEKIAWKVNGDVTEKKELCVRTPDGCHYVIGNENAGASFRGHTGRKFLIEFTDGPHKGQVIKTTNLWHQGTIPDELKEYLPVNAKFLPLRECFLAPFSECLAEMDCKDCKTDDDWLDNSELDDEVQ